MTRNNNSNNNRSGNSQHTSLCQSLTYARHTATQTPRHARTHARTLWLSSFRVCESERQRQTDVRSRRSRNSLPKQPGSAQCSLRGCLPTHKVCLCALCVDRCLRTACDSLVRPYTDSEETNDKENEEKQRCRRKVRETDTVFVTAYQTPEVIF